MSARTFRLSDAVRHGLWLALVPSAWLLPIQWARQGDLAIDAHAYWAVWRTGLYALPPGSRDAFNYSPAFAQIIRLFTLFPWPVFLGMWYVATAAVLLWLLWPMPARWRWLTFAVLLAPAVAVANIDVFLGAACALGLTTAPAAWVFPLLTKITPGLGPLWYLVRREWRALGIAVGTTAAVVAISFATAPDLWVRWIHFVATSPTPTTQVGYPPLALRLAAAVLVVVWGALTDRRWTVVIGVILAIPLWSASVILIAAALPRAVQRPVSPARHESEGWRRLARR